MQPFSVDHILIYYHVVKEGGIRPASAVLGRTPSTISEAMEKLRSLVGEPLYTTGPWALTAKGAEFYRETAGPIGDILTAQSALGKRSVKPPLRVGTSHYVLQEYMVPIVDVLTRELPDVRITYRSGTRKVLEDMLSDGDLDLAVLTYDTPRPGIMCQELLTLPVMLLTPDTVAVENVNRFLADQAGHRQLACPPPEDAVTRRFFDLLRQQGIHWTATHDADETSLVPWIVARGRAVGPCPGAMSLVRRPGVRAWPTECQPVTVGAFWCRQLRPVVKTVLGIIAQTARRVHDEGRAGV